MCKYSAELNLCYLRSIVNYFFELVVNLSILFPLFIYHVLWQF
jgi:hypothetical protein